MGLTRAECANMSDTMLQVSLDGRIHRLRSAWEQGDPGSLSDVYDLAVLHAEHVIRGHCPAGPMPAAQLELPGVKAV